MTAADYRRIIDQEVERARKADGSGDEQAVAEAIFARASFADLLAAFLEAKTGAAQLLAVGALVEMRSNARSRGPPPT
jgi:hypothetical protein